MSGANFSLEGRTALVIGGTSGIGLEIALGFQAAGARVWLQAVTQTRSTQASRSSSRRTREAPVTRWTPAA